MIAVMGFDVLLFCFIVIHFVPLFNNNMPYMCNTIVGKDPPCGWKENIWHKDYLGLMLMWTCTCGSLFVLHLIFGMATINLCLYLKFAVCIIVDLLKRAPRLKLQFQARAKTAVLDDIWVTMDSLKLTIEMAVTE